MNLIILYVLSLFTILHAPEKPATEDLTIFSPSRTYHYQAIFINAVGDTLSRERITLKPTGQPWQYQKSQTAFEIHYKYTPQDSIKFGSYPNPKSKKKNKPLPYSWERTETTGAIETKEEVWIHPIRGNQYNYTEVAPFPKVQLDSLKTDGEWRSTIYVLNGWGAFKGKVESHYKVAEQTTRQYGNLTLTDCWFIRSVGDHGKLDKWLLRLLAGKGKELGDSHLDFYFHPKYGFLEMHYRFYDGVRISFVLEEVVDKNV